MKDAISSIYIWASTKPDIQNIWIFGSRAKGLETITSDIDIAVETYPGDEGALHWHSVCSQWHQQLAAILPWEVQLEWYDPQGSTPIISCSLKESVHVYSQKA